MATTIFPASEADQPNRPSASAFKQQKLPAWQPILTAGTVLPTFFCIAFIFIPVGIGLLVLSNKVTEIVIDYTQCEALAGGGTCAEKLLRNPGAQCKCRQNFTLPNGVDKEVFIYYGLTNYYQNHRRYVKSRDDNQLLGKSVVISDTSECAPFHKRFDSDNVIRPIAPCGAIANSLFNDTYKIKWQSSPNTPSRYIPLMGTGIAWATDLKGKFHNPPVPRGQPLSKAFVNSSQPLYWPNPVYELYKTDPACLGRGDPQDCIRNNGYENEAFIVWMRTAALPSFRKLYARVDSTQEFNYKGSLPKGVYILEIDYNYPVTSFKGTKRVIISNTSFLGGKNPFLGIAYLVVGAVCLVLAFVFLIIHKKYGKSNNELLSINQRTPYTS